MFVCYVWGWHHKQNEVTKFLGVTVDSLLSWGSHIDLILRKLALSHYVVWQLRYKVERSILISYYHAYVGSSLSYGVVAWGNAVRVGEILTSQKKILRTLGFKCYRHLCRELFKELKILTIISVYILQCAVYIKKNKNLYVTSNDVAVDYTLRNGDCLRLPPHKLSLAARSSFVMPIKIFNHLPNPLKEINNLIAFKANLKKLLLQNTIYSLKEFFALNFEVT